MNRTSTVRRLALRGLWLGAAALTALGCTAAHSAPAAAPTGARDARQSEDELAIRSLLDRASDAINHHEWGRLEALLAHDVVWEALPPVGFRLDGIQAVRAFFAQNEGKIEVLVYELFGTDVQIQHPTAATARSSMRELLHLRQEGRAVQLVGTYVDSFVKTGGSWRFSKRRFQLRYEDDAVLPKRLGGVSSSLAADRAEVTAPEVTAPAGRHGD